MTGLTVSSYVVMESTAIKGKIISHVFLNGREVLSCWHDSWKQYLRLMTLKQFDRVSIRTS